MIAIDGYKGEPVGVLGLGRTGCAAADSLAAGGAHVIAWDDSKKMRARAGSRFLLRPPDHSDWCGIKMLVPSPGISETHDIIKNTALLKIPAAGDVELFGRMIASLPSKIRPTIIAITGTNGKSTVTALIADILQMGGRDVQMGGNIGIPVLALAPPKKNRIYVLEISSYQASLVKKFAPSIAVQLNISPDHTQRHGSLAAYAAAKARLFSRLGKNDLAIIGVGDDFGIQLADRLKSQTQIMRLPDDISPPPSCCNKRLAGQHNRQNIMAAWAVAQAMNISPDLFAAALKSFPGLPHRMEEAAKIGVVRFINDSKATNAAAARQALAAYRDIYWLAGGAAKAEGFDDLRGALSSVRHAYLFGAAAQALGDFLGGDVAWTRCQSLCAAVHQAAHDAQKNGGGVVLLSPACASFDHFADFAERGRAFFDYARAGQKLKRMAFIAAGGTGGGLFPAESLARELRRRGFQCVLMTDRRALPLIDRALWDGVYSIFSSPIAGRSPLSWLSAVFRMGIGVFQSLKILMLSGSKKTSKIIIGFGGYPSLPPLCAAIFLRQPILIHEPGASLGRANRLMRRFAHGAASSFPLEEKSAAFTLTGNPVRQDFIRLSHLPYQAPDRDKVFRLVVFAGSQGAQIFDDIVPQALSLVASTGRKIRIVQQCRQNENKIRAAYQKAGIDAECAPFFENLPHHIAHTHLVIARAGASTISELSVLGRPAIIIPITGAAAHEQNANAQSLARAGAAWVMDEKNLTAETLARQVERLMDDSAALIQAAQAAHNHAQTMGCLDAAAKLADYAETLIPQKPNEAK